MTAWRWSAGRRGARCLEDVDGEARRFNWPVSLLGKYLKAPGAGPLKGHLRDVEAPHVSRLVVHVPCPVRMDVHVIALLHNLQPGIGYLHLGLQPGLLAMECVDPQHDIGIVEELVLLQEPKGQAVLPNHQFRRHYHRLEPPACLWREPRRWHRSPRLRRRRAVGPSPLTPGHTGRAKEPQSNKNQDQELLHHTLLHSWSLQALQPNPWGAGAVDPEEPPQPGISVWLPVVAVAMVAWGPSRPPGAISQLEGRGG